MIYGLANIADKSIQFEDCVFNENYANTNTIHMLLSSLVINECDFINNYALAVTHGITLISSNIVVSRTKIRFDAHCHWAFHFLDFVFMMVCHDEDNFFERLDLSKLDTGFFTLYLTSSALITDNTVIQDLVAQKQAVAYVIG